jgi:YidC/Oxa1 family membrane protein insertase
LDTRRILLAVVLSLAVLLAWQHFFPATPTPPEPATTAAGPDAAPGTPPPASTAPAPGATGASGAPGAPPPAAAGGVQAAPAGPPVAAAREEQVVIEDERVRAVFSNRGAQLVSYVLKQHRSEDGKLGLELVQQRANLPAPFGLVAPGLAPHPLSGALFAVQERGPRAVSFRYNGPAGTARKRFRFDPNGLFQVEVTVERGAPWRVLLGPGLRNLSSEETESRYLHRRVAYMTGEGVERLDPMKSGALRLEAAGLRWAGLEDNYYLAAVVPGRGVERVLVQPLLVQPAPEGGPARFLPVPPEDRITSEQEKLAREGVVLLEPGAPTLQVTSFWGAKEYYVLRDLPFDLEKSVDLGFFGLLALPLLAGLHWIHDNIVANYGWAIILMTVLIKILLLPLTHKSYVSMQKMQKLNPKMQGIREKYRGKMRDKQGRPNLEAQRKMNEELMGLYKSEGVNPAGGCLPMLLQLPILFAFYNLLTAAVELRNAPWMLWIHDLSTKDPYYVLPIVMAATQFVQTKMTPMAGDPMQRRIFQMMPLFMLVFFLPSPSGLVLYWLTNNVLTILQQGVYNRLRRRQESA